MNIGFQFHSLTMWIEYFTRSIVIFTLSPPAISFLSSILSLSHILSLPHYLSFSIFLSFSTFPISCLFSCNLLSLFISHSSIFFSGESIGNEDAMKVAQFYEKNDFGKAGRWFITSITVTVTITISVITVQERSFFRHFQSNLMILLLIYITLQIYWWYS